MGIKGKTMSFVASLERDARRVNLKHVILQHSRVYTLAVYTALIALTFAVDRHEGRVFGSLVPRVMLLLMMTAAVFRFMGGYIARLEPVEHGKKLKSHMTDVCSDMLSIGFRHPIWCFAACTVLAEVSQIFRLRSITACILTVLWFYPALQRRWRTAQ